MICACRADALLAGLPSGHHNLWLSRDALDAGGDASQGREDLSSSGRSARSLPV